MTNQQILEKAIKKAIDGGWGTDWVTASEGVTVKELVAKTCSWFIDHPITTQTIIYNHVFAKALWGEGRPLTLQERKDKGFSGGGGQIKTLGWQHHLQNMVIAPDPIKYLGANP